MALHLRQDLGLRMEQKLKLTPQMIQSIEILLLPQMALEERILHEVEANPVLEIDEGEAPAAEAPSEDDPFPEPAESAEPAAAVTDSYRRDLLDRDHEEFSDFLKRRSHADDDDAPDKMKAIEATEGPQPSLAEHLLDQLRFVEAPAVVRECLPILAWALDRRGYLTTTLNELFEEDHLEAAEQAWELLRGCDPAGIGARDLRDCLLLQLRREPGDNSFEIQLVENHLDDLLRNRLPVIAQQLGVEVTRIQEGLEVVKRLDPNPGLPFAPSQNRFVIPDVLVERDEQGEWIVSVPDGNLPKVRIDQSYYELYENQQLDPKEKSFLKEKLANARFIIDAVNQRRRTLLKIATEIVKHQRAFLEQGQEHLRPLMRQDIADRIGMHVATVSRAVKDKFIQTPGGILPLADFFSGGIATQDGSEAESSKTVKLRIQGLIDHEDPEHPLSDQAIADTLAKEGLDISRRTVTKYRIAEGVPSTRQRRRFR